ncbi:MAG: nucleotidyltransferase domain-containing protein [Nitrospirae bacterium]|nr:nucleotidyltransferase domain-containing protein [Nitrospirota bacterium]
MKLTVKEKQVVVAFKKSIEQQYPKELVCLILFGSKARGDAGKESDIDILVVIRSENWKLGDLIREIGYSLELEHGLVLSIQVISQQHLEQLKAIRSQFLEAVEEEGIVV